MNAKRGKISGGWHWSPKHVTMDSLDSDWSRQKSIFSDWLEQLKSIIVNGNLKEKNVGKYSNLKNFSPPKLHLSLVLIEYQ